MVQVTPIVLSYNTAYLVQAEEERILVDTGPDYGGACDVIEAAVGGREPTMVIATHGHLDHAGLGSWWQARGARVAIHADDAHLARAPHFSVEGEFEAFAEYIRSSGAPPGLQARLVRELERRRSWVRRAATATAHPPARPADRWPTGLRYLSFEPDVVLTGDTTVGAGVSVLQCPGHTPGNIVLILEAAGFLFSGDQLLPDITPTPGVQFVRSQDGGWERFPSLPTFLGSLEQLATRDFRLCYPGHGEPFGNVGEVVGQNIDQVEQRTARVRQELAEGPGTVHAISERLYPRALGRRWWQIAATVQGHLDLLRERGEAVVDDGTWATTR